MNQLRNSLNNTESQQIFPLSYGQKAIWSIQALTPESVMFHLAGALRIRGELDKEILRNAFNEFVTRHPLLRANYRLEKGEPIQIIREEPIFAFNYEDLRPLGKETLDDQLTTLLRRPFDLEKDPLFRVHLFRQSEKEHVLVLMMHHIISDLWSAGIVFHEWPKIYSLLKNGEKVTLPGPDSTYFEYIEAQNALVNNSRGERLWTYWQQQLAGELPVLKLPTDYPRPVVQTYNGSSCSFQLSESLTRSINELCQKWHTTPYTFLLAVFQVLLYRYTGQNDLLVGSPMTGRTKAKEKNVIGYFVNPVVIRGKLSPETSFETFSEQIRHSVHVALEHRKYPFSQLVERLQPIRSSSVSPLFQAMFIYQQVKSFDSKVLRSLTLGVDSGPIDLDHLRVEVLPLEHQFAQFDLTLAMTPMEDELVGRFEYNTNLFERKTIERMISHFKNLLVAVVNDPTQTLSTLPMLSEDERMELLETLNTTKVTIKEQTLHQLFEEQVDKTPEFPAIKFEGDFLTYRELNHHANHLAHSLIKKGVGPEVLVGICLERSLDLTIGILGVWKAGGAYVPLDPHYPRERLTYVLEDSQVTVLLTHEKWLTHLPPHPATVICLDSKASFLEQESRENPKVSLKSNNRAYVIYTSGSTGKPKGCINTHRGIVNRLQWMKKEFHLTSKVRVLQKTPFTFDVSVWELFCPFLAGGCLVLARPEGHKDSTYLVGMILKEEITLIHFVPSMLQVFLLENGLEKCTSLEHVVCSGEALPYKLQERFFARMKARLHNLYGPTETSIEVTYWECQPGSPRKTVPIGRPIDNIQLYVLDSQFQLVPMGMPGELFIGGVGVGLGYINQPDLTNDRFFLNPYRQTVEDILYKTGDIVRYGSNGALEYIGRTDNQVKIRGFRIELSEVEGVLVRHPQILDCTVLAREDNPGDKRLVAYLVEQGSPIEINLLRNYLRDRLPEYMVPSIFMILKSLPLNANGKIDRHLLPAPDASRLDWHGCYIAPRTPLEDTLAKIWEQVLGIESVGVEDNFFELGGDSILSIQIVANTKKLGLILTPKDMFECQTIAELAQVIGKSEVNSYPQSLVTGAQILLPIQKWFFEHNLSSPQHFNQSVLFSLKNSLELRVLEDSLRSLVVHHDALRLRFTETEGKWQANYRGAEEVFLLEVLDLSLLAKSDHASVLQSVMAKTQGGLDLTQGPLMRVVYLTFGPHEPPRLLWVIHHLIMDGVSWRILLEDFQSAYNQLQAGTKVMLPPKTTSYQAWAEQLVSYANSMVILKENYYGSKHIPLEITPLPLDNPEGTNTGHTMGSVIKILNPADTLHVLRGVPQSSESKIQEILLTVLVRTIARWTGNNSLLLHIEGHGREPLLKEMDLSRTVGWFTSLYPVFFDLKNDLNYKSAINRIKAQLNLIPNKGMDYGLFRYLSENEAIVAELKNYPQPQISFTYLGQLDSILSDSLLFQNVPEWMGNDMGPDVVRAHLIDVVCFVTGGELHLQWLYSQDMFRSESIERVANDCLEDLQNFSASFPRFDNALTQMFDHYPLSPLQQGMLFHALYSLQGKGEGDYVTQLVLDFQGDFQTPIFKRAWDFVLNRHTILRTSFQWEGVDTPYQIVHNKARISIEEKTWTGLSLEEQDLQFRSYLETDRESGFDFSHPPMRLTLFKRSETNYRMVWSHHHILLDGWSLPIVLGEVFQCYEASCRGEEIQLQAPLPYADYIQWLGKQDMQSAENFWHEKLQGFDSPTPLGTGRLFDSPNKPLDPRKTYRAHVLNFTSWETLSLQTWVMKNQLTLNTLLQGAWAYLLSRYSGLQDVVFGVTLSGRNANLPDIEQRVGLFINTLPLRVQISPEAPLATWLQKLQTLNSELRQVEYCSLIDIHRWSEIPQGVNLFDSILVFENYPVDSTERKIGEKIEIKEVQCYEQTHYPLTIQVFPGEELTVKLMYDINRFDKSTIERISGHIRVLLKDMVSGTPKSIANLSYLTETERKQLLASFNSKMVKLPNKTIHELFEEQVKQTPDEIAIVFEGESLTYRALDKKANQLAHFLRRQGVGPETLVGICFKRSLTMMISLFGILKAGGAYLPIDPEYPIERIRYVFQESCLTFLLTSRGLIKRMDFLERIIYFDEIVFREEDSVRLIQESTPNHLAYIIFTSGSAGKPKGVMIEHQSVTNLLQGVKNRIAFQPKQSFLALATIAFDMSVLELFLPLTTGLRLVLANEEQQRDSRLLSEVIRKEQIDILHITPSRLQMLLGTTDGSYLKPLSILMVGAEPVPASLVKELKKRTQARIYNMYGPTETTVWSAIHDLTDQEDIRIGLPIANTQFVVLGPDEYPVPFGIPGELYIGGHGLARGYLKRPELTKEKFRYHPVLEISDARLYKTGDIVRSFPDGTLEYIGRIDHQVKIRGFRIELGEIEAVLQEHPDILENAILAWEDINGDSYLVAYVVGKPKFTLDQSQLRSSLRENLPEYMIPGVWMMLDVLPRTPNGKLDRKGLPTPHEIFERTTSQDVVAPRDNLEERIRDIWAQVLPVKAIGIRDNFYELGGHSLLAIKILSRLREDIQSDLPLRTLFECPTVVDLAERIRSVQKGPLISQTNSKDQRMHPTLVPLQVGNYRYPLFIVHPAGGDVVCYLELARELPNQSIYGLQALGLMEKQKRLNTIEEMATYYLEAIRSVQAKGPYFLSGWSMGGLIAFEIAQQLEKQGEEVALLALLDTMLPKHMGIKERVKSLVGLFDYLPRKLTFRSLSQSALDLALTQIWSDYKKNKLTKGKSVRETKLLSLDFKNLTRYIGTYKTNMQASRRYTPQSYSKRVILFKPTDTLLRSNPTNSWDQYTSGLQVIEVPGNHYTMVNRTNVKTLGEVLHGILQNELEIKAACLGNTNDQGL